MNRMVDYRPDKTTSKKFIKNFTIDKAVKIRLTGLIHNIFAVIHDKWVVVYRQYVRNANNDDTYATKRLN